MRSFLAHAAMLLAVLLLVTACGGSGSTSTVYVPQFAPADLFQGTFGFARIGGTQGGPEEIAAGWGEITVDPVLVDATVTENRTGVINGPMNSVSSTNYLVHGDRRFVRTNLGTGLPDRTGGITPEGDVAIDTLIRNGAAPEVGIYVKRAAGLDDSVLSGSYFFAAFGGNIPGIDTSSRWGRVTFDGAGGGTIDSIGMNIEGVVPAIVLGVFTYGVASDGVVDWQFTGGAGLVGSCTADGGFVVVSGGVDPADDPLCIVLVRAGSGFGTADFAGTWFANGLSQAVGPSAYSTFSGAMYADDVGSIDMIGTRNEEGAIVGSPIDASTVTVDPDGALTLQTSGGDTLVGGLSADGRFGLLSGPTNGGSDPAMFLLIR